MIFTRRHFLGAAIAASAGASACRTLAQSIHAPPLPSDEPPVPSKAQCPSLLDEALIALDRHSARVGDHSRIGLVDFGLPSSEPRFHLVNVEQGRIEQSWLVAHGNGSDPAATGMLQRFSNRPGSNASSRGAFLVSHTYHGRHGRSQRLIGLDPSNDEALDRAIVIHGAKYVDPSLIDAQGRIGRSQGCFTVEVDQVDRVIDELGEGRLLYAGRSA